MPRGDGTLARLREGGMAVGGALGRLVIVVLSPVIVAILIPVPIIRRVVIRRRYLRLADDMFFGQGTMLSRRFRGDGVSVGFYLAGAALREGSWEDVLRVLSDDLEKSGYRPPDRRDADRRRGLQFSPPTGRGLPSLTLSVHLPGEVIGTSDIVVPSGHTGVDFTFA